MQDSVSMDVLYYQRDPERGWQFRPEAAGCTPDTVSGGLQFIRELYEKQNSKEKSVSVALTWCDFCAKQHAMLLLVILPCGLLLPLCMSIMVDQ